MPVFFSVSSSTGVSKHSAVEHCFRQTAFIYSNTTPSYSCDFQQMVFGLKPSFCEGALRHRITREIYSNNLERFGLEPLSVAA